jgi:hypothetical protein
MSVHVNTDKEKKYVTYAEVTLGDREKQVIF